MTEPDDPFDWPAPMMSGTADRRLRYAVTREPATPFGRTISVRVLPRRWRTLDDLVREGMLPAGAAEPAGRGAALQRQRAGGRSGRRRQNDTYRRAAAGDR